MPPPKSTEPPNDYTPGRTCVCERPNVRRDLDGWIACLKCGKPPEGVQLQVEQFLRQADPMIFEDQ